MHYMERRAADHAGHAGHAATLSSLRELLTSLLLLSPPHLSHKHLSDNLLLRHRLLGLPSSTPYAHDMLEPSHSLGAQSFLGHLSIPDDIRLESQHTFVSWLSHPSIELDIPQADVHDTAQTFFLKRLSVMDIALQGDKDPINPVEYQLMCSKAWHGQGRILVRFPNSSSANARLLMMVIRTSDGELKLDNLFALHHDDNALESKALHPWTTACAGDHRRKAAELMEPAEGSGGAEYITQADDFWAGFSDEEVVQEVTPAQTRQRPAASSALHGEAEPEDASRTASGVTKVSENAIKDIVRGAYTLHCSLEPTQATSHTASIEAFIRLVRSAIANPP